MDIWASWYWFMAINSALRCRTKKQRTYKNLKILNENLLVVLIRTTLVYKKRLLVRLYGIVPM